MEYMYTIEEFSIINDYCTYGVFLLWYLMFSVVYLHIYQETRNKFFLACMVKKRALSIDVT